jgi:serine/threonine-protein kinase
MGSVWAAEHLTLKTRFAVKFISPGLMQADPTALVRFTNEARSAASIKSPHVVSTTDYGVTDEGEPYIVMELLDGETLYDRLLRDGPMDPSAVASVISQVCRGLRAAHDLGILHRDIKPENVFICAGNEPRLVKLIDFGLAKMTLGDTALMPTAAGAQVGTPAFMSPEQIDADGTVDHRADLWGTAVVAYHALTGKHPFRGENVAEFRDNLRNQVFAPATEHRPELPEAIDHWFERGLEPDPDERFESSTELAETLIDALGVAEVVPPIPPPRASVPSFSGKFRALPIEEAAPLLPQAEQFSVTNIQLQQQLHRRTVFLVGLCLLLAAIAIALALR